jgi:hypothetical protein
MSDVVTRPDNMYEALDDIASQTSHLRYLGRSPEPNELLETIFVSLISGLLLSYFWSPETIWLPLAAVPTVIISLVVFSAIKLIHFGVIRIITTGIVIGLALTAWLTYGVQLLGVDLVMINSRLLGILFQGLAGAVMGLVGGIILMFWGSSD